MLDDGVGVSFVGRVSDGGWVLCAFVVFLVIVCSRVPSCMDYQV